MLIEKAVNIHIRWSRMYFKKTEDNNIWLSASNSGQKSLFGPLKALISTTTLAVLNSVQFSGKPRLRDTFVSFAL